MSTSIKKNVVAKSLLTIVNIVIPMLLGPYIARTLDVALYTVYNKALTLMAWFLPFALFGIPTFGLREISAVKYDKGELNRRFSQIFYFNILSSFITSVAFFLIIFFKFNIAVYYLLLLQLFSTFLSVEYVNEAFENFGFILYKNLFLRIIYIAFILIFVRRDSDIVSFTLISTGFNILNNVFSFLYIKKYICIVKCAVRDVFSQFKQLFPVLLLSNTGMLYTNLDCLFLSRLEGYEITYYILVRTILMSIINVFLSIIQVSIPRLSKFYANGEKSAFLALLKKSSNAFYFFGIPCCIGLSLLGREIMLLYGGEKYAAAGSVMSMFALRFILYILITVATDAVLFTTRNEKKLTVIYLIGGCINILGNSLLVLFNRMTSVSVIITTMLAELIVIFLQQYAIWRIDKNLITITKDFFKYLLLSVMIVLLAIAFFPGLGVNATVFERAIYLLKVTALCCGIYVVCLLLLKDTVIVSVLKILKKY